MKIDEYLKGKRYPGRIIVGGATRDLKPILIYVVMGRSDKSRNRVLSLDGEELKTKLYDNSTCGDDLIIYSAKEQIGNKILLANGDHSASIASSLRRGESLIQSLDALEVEPDKPNYTPRIALAYDLEEKNYEMAIVRRNGGKEEKIVWKYPFFAGYAHIIHTYEDDSTPLLSFSNDPVLVEVDSDLSSFSSLLWDSLDNMNRVSIYFSDGKNETIINQRECDNVNA